VIQRAIRREDLRRIVGLVAACALLLQSLLMGASRAVPAVYSPPAPSGVHYLDHAQADSVPAVHGDGAQASTPAAHHRNHDARHGSHEPTKPANAPHCFWCILAKKLGLGLGPPPTIAAVLSPLREAVEVALTIRAETSDHRLHSLPPLGARAPPELA
jgi:hypothetical protein